MFYSLGNHPFKFSVANSVVERTGIQIDGHEPPILICMYAKCVTRRIHCCMLCWDLKSIIIDRKQKGKSSWAGYQIFIIWGGMQESMPHFPVAWGVPIVLLVYWIAKEFCEKRLCSFVLVVIWRVMLGRWRDFWFSTMVREGKRSLPGRVWYLQHVADPLSEKELLFYSVHYSLQYVLEKRSMLLGFKWSLPFTLKFCPA